MLLRLIKEIKIAKFLEKNKEKLLNKSDIYKKYYDIEKNTVNTKYINDLTDKELDEIENILDTEKTYL